MQIPENGAADPESSYLRFKAFLEEIRQLLGGILKVNQTHLFLKMKIPAYKDLGQVLSLYENTFLKSVSSNSKKKSGTILIIWTILKFAEIQQKSVEAFNDHNWMSLALLFPNFSLEKIKMRWFSAQKSVEQKLAWTEEEDRILANLVREISTQVNEKNFKWTEIAEKYNKMTPIATITRLGKHCRERWLNHLDPSIKKGDWTAVEDIKLLESILQHGRKWSQIAKILGSRNENSVKNRFFSLLNKFRKKKNVDNDRDSIVAILKNLKDLSPQSISNNMIKKINMTKDKTKRIKHQNSIKKNHVKSEKVEPIPSNLKRKQPSHKLVNQSFEEQSKPQKRPKISEEDRASIHSESLHIGLNDKGKSFPSMATIFNETPNNLKTNTNSNSQCAMTHQETRHSETCFQETPKNFLPNTQPNQLPFYNQEPPQMPDSYMNFQMPPYPPPPAFMASQFPYMFYQMPMMDSINEEMRKAQHPFFKNFTPGNDGDFKNVSQLISSMSLSDEYLMEGQKLLSDLTFKTESLSSMQDRLSFILPHQQHSSNKSNSSLLSRKLLTPSSMLINNNNFRFEDPTFNQKPKKNAERKKTFHPQQKYYYDHENNAESNRNGNRNGMERLLKEFNDGMQKNLSTPNELNKLDEGTPIQSLNHLE